MRIDLVGTTADFQEFGPRPSLPINHLLCENRQTAGRIGQDGLTVPAQHGIHDVDDRLASEWLRRNAAYILLADSERLLSGSELMITTGMLQSAGSSRRQPACLRSTQVFSSCDERCPPQRRLTAG